MNQTFSRESTSEENASGYSQVRLWLSLSPGAPELAGDIAVFSNSIGSGLAFNLTDGGTLSFDTSGLGLDSYWLESHVHSSASSTSTLISQSVPEPPVMALFAIALMGIMAVRKRAAWRAS